MIPNYVNRVRTCQTLNQVNSVHIGLERLITPPELVYLWRVGVVEDRLCEAAAAANPSFALPEFKANVNEWLRRTKHFHDLSRKTQPEPFKRREIAKTLTLFFGPGERTDKTLLLCFNGVLNAPMMPPVTMLQALDASRVDIAMLKDIPFRSFRDGMADIADSPEAVMAALPGLLDFSAYRQICVLGISGGGLAGLFMAQRLGLQAVMMCGSRGLEDERWILDDGTSVAEWISAGLRIAPDLTVKVVCGAGYERDQRSAGEIAQLLGVPPVAVASPNDEEIGHNMLFPQLVAGSLSRFLVDMLGL